MHNELTKKDIQMMKDELDYRRIQLRPKLLEAVKEARGFGDLSENSEYDEAKNEQGKLYSRIAEVEEILANCVVIEEDENDHNAVRLGSRITVLDLEFDEQETYEVVGSQEADPMNGRISEDSPFGRALLGKEVGEEVLVEAPAGNLHYKVLDIQKA